MKRYDFKNKFVVIIFFLICFRTYAEDQIKNKKNGIIWEKFNQKNDQNINWQPLTEKEIKNKIINWEVFTKEEIIEENLKNSTIPKTLQNKTPLEGFFSFDSEEKVKPLQISPSLPINNFLEEGIFLNTFNTTSSFDGGEASGTGNQNYSYRIDYGLDDTSTISAYISEADDPYYYKIKNKQNLPSKNLWRNYAINYKTKLYSSEQNKWTFSLDSSLEIWNLETLYKKQDNSIGRFVGKKFVGSAAIPTTLDINEKTNLTIVPRISFLPTSRDINSNAKKDSFYGNNYSLGIGLDYELSKELYFITSYSFQLGPGYNSFNDNLEFSRNNIYSYGLRWNPSPKVGLETSITNAFGSTPATNNLTIPSGNLPLYSFNLKLNTGYSDPPQKPFNKRQRTLLHKGHSINSALLPEEGRNQVWLDFDNKGNYFGFYGYSFSNLFQVEIANLGSIKDSNRIKNDKFSSLTDTYYAKGNLNNRFGGKLVLLSPLKGDPFWLSNRTTLGRDQKSGQGYLFSELINSYEINPKLAMTINPKLTWNGIKSFSGGGFGLNYELQKKIQLIGEYNINFSDSEHSNSSFLVRYLPSINKSIDFYISNALGTQDMTQLLKSENQRIGIKLNYLF